MISNSRYSLTAVLVVVTVSPLISCKQFSPNKNDAKLQEVERLSADLPKYPGFQALSGGNTFSKPMLASIHKHYKSDAGYDDVKAFYSTKLMPAGWKLKEERNLKDWWRDYGGRELTFEKGEYSVVIEYRGDKAIDPDWNYAIGIGWHDK
jgi:hypothetical protein